MIIEAILLGLVGGAAAAAAKTKKPAPPPAPLPILNVQAEVKPKLPDGTTPAQAALITTGPAQAAAAMASWKVSVAPGLSPGSLATGAPSPFKTCPPGQSLQPSSRQANAMLTCQPTPSVPSWTSTVFKPAITPNANTATGVLLKNTILAGLRG